MGNIFENVDVLTSKFERVVSQLPINMFIGTLLKNDFTKT